MSFNKKFYGKTSRKPKKLLSLIFVMASSFSQINPVFGECDGVQNVLVLSANPTTTQIIDACNKISRKGCVCNFNFGAGLSPDDCYAPPPNTLPPGFSYTTRICPCRCTS